VSKDPRAIHVDEFLPYPPQNVWRPPTEPELIGRWLMPNDLRLEVGHLFTFRGPSIPAAGFGGTGYSEVLDFEPEKMPQIEEVRRERDRRGCRVGPRPRRDARHESRRDGCAVVLGHDAHIGVWDANPARLRTRVVARL
jgi:hypothetical protein